VNLYRYYMIELYLPLCDQICCGRQSCHNFPLRLTTGIYDSRL